MDFDKIIDEGEFARDSMVAEYDENELSFEKQFEDFVEGGMTNEKMEQIFRQSLNEMEYMTRQQELEQAELEQALAISLAMEEERLRGLNEPSMSDAKVIFEFSMLRFELYVSVS
jgi:hypothetical protein